jgi:acyl-CoA dehydrogenase
MTAFALTEAQRALAGQVREIAASQLRPITEAGVPGHVNRELIKAMGQLGLLPRLFPGLGGDALSREAAATDLCLLRGAMTASASAS